ncbi:MAG: hypothetical protein ABIO02_04745 [Patescibacteria group bacterium]
MAIDTFQPTEIKYIPELEPRSSGPTIRLYGGRTYNPLEKQLIPKDPSAKVLVVAYSHGDPDISAESIQLHEEFFNENGHHNVVGIARNHPDRDQHYNHLDDAALVMLTAGVQSRFISTVHKTRFAERIIDYVKNGGEIQGNSAGEQVMGSSVLQTHTFEDYFTPEAKWVRDHGIKLASSTMYKFDYLFPGTGILEGVITDSHANKRGLARLLSAVERVRDDRTNKPHLGIAVDECVSVVIKKNGEECSVEGATNRSAHVIARGVHLSSGHYTDGVFNQIGEDLFQANFTVGSTFNLRALQI